MKLICIYIFFFYVRVVKISNLVGMYHKLEDYNIEVITFTFPENNMQSSVGFNTFYSIPYQTFYSQPYPLHVPHAVREDSPDSSPSERGCQHSQLRQP